MRYYQVGIGSTANGPEPKPVTRLRDASWIMDLLGMRMVEAVDDECGVWLAELNETQEKVLLHKGYLTLKVQDAVVEVEMP